MEDSWKVLSLVVALVAVGCDAGSSSVNLDAGRDPGPIGNLGLGAACTQATQCASRFCSDSVCCDGPCTGTCRSCLAAFTGSAPGNCAAIAADTDPENECAPALGSCELGECDGASACKTLADGEVCRPVAGDCDTAELCNAGSCPADAFALGAVLACQPLMCDGLGPDCPATCSDSDDCSGPGAVCHNGACVRGKLVFVTASDIGADAFGGLAGADALCQKEATLEGLAGTYKAWLSTSAVAVADRLTHATVPYVLTNKAVVANDWADLVDGDLLSPIDHFADGTQVGTGGGPIIAGVWTGTGSSGSQAGPNCLDWTTSVRWESATIGRTLSSDSGWTDFNDSASCMNVYYRRLYCFEQ